jgi:hypothetical protein
MAHRQEEITNGNGDAKEEPGEQPKKIMRRFQDWWYRGWWDLNLLLLCIYLMCREKKRQDLEETRIAEEQGEEREKERYQTCATNSGFIFRVWGL